MRRQFTHAIHYNRHVRGGMCVFVCVCVCVCVSSQIKLQSTLFCMLSTVLRTALIAAVSAKRYGGIGVNNYNGSKNKVPLLFLLFAFPIGRCTPVRFPTERDLQIIDLVKKLFAFQSIFLQVFLS